MTSARHFRPPQTLPIPPADFKGSWPEYVCHTELERQGYRPDIDFRFQSSRLGGNRIRGGVRLDFLFNRPPGLAVNVNGVYFHYVQNGGINRLRDIAARGAAARVGIRLIFIDDDRLLRDPAYYVSEALAGRDHSRMTGR